MSKTYKDFKLFKDLDFFVMIPSKGRAEKCKGSISLFPEQSCLYVHESEEKEYRKHNPEIPIVTHKKTRGYGSVLNGAIKLAKDSGLEYMFIIDDDMDAVYSLVGNRQRKFNIEQRYLAVLNAVQVMEDIKCYFYVFSTCSTIIKYQQHLPYKVGFSLPQGAFIVNTQKINIKLSEKYSYYEDFDFCMEYILKHRYYIIENRTLVTGNVVDSLEDGGCNSHRTEENETLSREWIKSKLKSHVSFYKNPSGNIRPSCLESRITKR